jgi:hypothetical protein
MNPLLREIEAFIETHGLSPSRFGIAAVGDQHLIKDIKAGRRLWPETESRIRLYMATFKADAA